MDISLGWFFKVPGLFILVGVLLIIIALVVFLVGSQKEKKAMSESVPKENNTDQGTESNMTTTTSVNDFGLNQGVTPVATVATPIVTDANNNQTIGVAPVVAAPVDNAVNIAQPIVNNAMATPVNNEMPQEVAPVSKDIVTPVISNEPTNNGAIPPITNSDMNNALNVITPVVTPDALPNNDMIVPISNENNTVNNETISNEQASLVNPTVVPIDNSVSVTPTITKEPTTDNITAPNTVTSNQVENVVTPMSEPVNNQVNEKTDVLQVVDVNALTPNIKETPTEVPQEIPVETIEKDKEDIEEI